MTGKVTLFLITPIVKKDFTDYEKIAPMLGNDWIGFFGLRRK